MDPTGARRGEHELVLEAANASVRVRPDEGGRLGSVIVAGHELLVTSDPAGLILWGSFPMAPFAGRIRRGRFSFAGRDHELPLGMPPHAIHGVVYDRPWSVLGADRIGIELDDRWPFRGRVEQRFSLDEDGLSVTMTLEAEEAMPVTIGWHPWFRRRIAGIETPVQLAFDADEMIVRDADGMPSGKRSAPTAGPWDDAFTGVRTPPVLAWGADLRLAIESTCAWWVVYSMPEHAICVEPQSGPPDAANDAPEVVGAGGRLSHEMRWRWDRG